VHSGAIIAPASRNDRKESRVRLQSRVCPRPSKFVSGQTELTIKQLVVPAALALTILIMQPVAGSYNDEVFLRLQATRDALVSQEKEIGKSYDNVTRQIDELRKRQVLLDSYRRQTLDAIRDVERAMENAR